MNMKNTKKHGENIMIKQHKIRDINRNPDLHKEIFVLKSDMEQVLTELIVKAVECGADADKLLEGKGGE